MGYIMELRKLVGSRPLIMAGSCVLVFNEEGHLLLQRRTDSLDWGRSVVRLNLVSRWKRRQHGNCMRKRV